MTFALLLLCLLAVSEALMFYLPPGTEKCFSDEYAFDVLVSGEFRVTTPGQEKTKKFSLLVSRAPIAWPAATTTSTTTTKKN